MAGLSPCRGRRDPRPAVPAERAGHHHHHDRAHHARGDELLAAPRRARRRPQDRRRHAARRSCATPKWRGPTLASSLTIADIDAGYGAVRVLHDVSLDGRRRRDRRAARHQRQRQEHADEVHHGHGAAERRQDHRRDRRHRHDLSAARPRRSSISASRWCPRAGGCSRS